MSPKTPRPPVMSGTTYAVTTACGKLFTTLNGAGGEEALLKMGNQGNCTSSFMAALGVIISIARRWGVPMAAFTKVLMATTCPSHNKVVTDLVVEDGDVYEVEKTLPCCIAALGKLLAEEVGGEEPYADTPEETVAKGSHIAAGCGRLDVFVGSANGSPVSVTAITAAPGSCANAIVQTLAKCLSIALQHGVGAEDLAKGLAGINCPHPTHKCSSCIDGIGKALLASAKEE